MGSNPASYSGGPAFKSRPAHHLYWLRPLMCSLSPPRHIPGYFKSGDDRSFHDISSSLYYIVLYSNDLTIRRYIVVKYTIIYGLFNIRIHRFICWSNGNELIARLTARLICFCLHWLKFRYIFSLPYATIFCSNYGVFMSKKIILKGR